MRSVASVWLLTTALAAAACGTSSQPPKPAAGSGLPSGQHQTLGVIESFGEGRGFVRIRHAEIPGYMRAMTMPFEPAPNVSLKDFAVGDSVRFGFDELDDGRRVIVFIEKTSAKGAP